MNKLSQRGSIFRQIIAVPEVGILIPLVGFILLFYYLNPIFLSPNNISTMLRAMSFIGVIALGQVFLMVSGEFDLSVGSTAGLSAIVCSYLLVTFKWAIFPAVMAGLFTGAALGR